MKSERLYFDICRRILFGTQLSNYWIFIIFVNFMFQLMTCGQRIGQSNAHNLLISAPKHYDYVSVYSENYASGTRIGLEECKHQFKWEKWNCPLLKPPTTSHAATRELAFARAILSAGLTYTLTKNCSSGLLQNCYCSDNPKPVNTVPASNQWTWGGCSESFKFAENLSEHFEKEESKDARAYVNRHNNGAGRQSVKRTMFELCKCHGVSGACTTQTCWKKLPEFREIGNYLKNKYKKALLADFQNGLPPRDIITYKYSKKQTSGIDAIAISAGELRQTALLYLEPSPDYCKQNDSYATLGRQCMRSNEPDENSSEKKKSCNTLCRQCGLRVRKTAIEVQTSCDCKFIWCCKVKCKSCIEPRNILTCSLL